MWTDSKGKKHHRYKYLTKCPNCKIKLTGHQEFDFEEDEVVTYGECETCGFIKNLDTN